MILVKDTDAAYLVLPESHNLIAGYYYFRNRMLDYYKGNPTPNVPILTGFNILKTMVSSSDEVETGGTF